MLPLSNRQARLLHELAETLCIVVVINGAWLCVFARLGAYAPLAFFANMFDLINTALAPILLAMALAAVLGAFLQRRLGFWLGLLTLAIAAWQVAAVLADAAPRTPAASADTSLALRVLTVNAYHDNSEPWRLRAVIERAAPDIVLIEEGEGGAGQEIMRTLPAFHRVLSCATPPCSLTILSRWPALRIPTPMPRERDLPDLLFAHLALPAPNGRSREIDVVAVHLPRGYRQVARHYRALLTEAIVRHRSAPVILGGDFNLPTGTAALADIAAETSLRRADRWIATYPANIAFPAFAAIDHMFVDPAFGVRGCRRLGFTGSDHYAIGCDLLLPIR